MGQCVMSGNAAAATAAKLARVKVVSAYPITPQTTIIEKIADAVASGELDAKYIMAESEHSAMQACISAAALGARTYTATSSQGLLLMHELLHWASGARLPVVMGVANRAVAPPWSVAADHTDAVAQRDTGWIQLFAESNQEVLDTTLQAFRVAEDPEVMLPAMVCEDAFFLTHTVEPVDVPSLEQADAFLPARPPASRLVPGRPGRLGSFAAPDVYMEFRKGLACAMERAAEAMARAEAEWEKLTGRNHGGPLPLYRCEGAEAVLITMGTATSTARTVVDALRARGLAVGLAKLRSWRPFPAQELVSLAREVPRLGVLDRSFTFGAAGAAFTEVAASLYAAPRRPALRGFVAGLGGRDITPAALEQMYGALLNDRGAGVEWVGLAPQGGGASAG